LVPILKPAPNRESVEGGKKMPKPRLLTLFLLLAMLAIPSLSVALQKGETFPPFSGKDLDGGTFELSSLKGTPVVIKIGTTWCGTCQEQEREIGKISGYLKDNGIHYVDIFIQESASKVRKYLSKDGRPMPDTVILDDGDIARSVNVYLIPRVILLDRDHKVYRDGDPLSSKNLQKQLQAILNNR